LGLRIGLLTRSIGLFALALAACDGALQFSEAGSPTGAGGAPGDASGDRSTAGDGSDASIDASIDAIDLRDAPGDPAGDPGMGYATPCYKDTDCPANKLHCDILSHQCVECIATVDCVVAPYLRCETKVHRCVECLTSTDCGPNATCHPDARVCIPLCQDGAACPVTAPYCDGSGSCAACRNNADCFQIDLCDLSIGRCAFCADDRSCTTAAPHCDPYNPGRERCKECLVPADCPPGKPYCDVHAGLCVGP
jgi:hypothetical protein